jgi:hypothetical protein
MKDIFDNETDRFFRYSLQHSTNIPRNKVWVEIEKQLDAENKRYVAGVYKRKYRLGPAIVLCLILGFSAWFYLRRPVGGEVLAERSSVAKKINPPAIAKRTFAPSIGSPGAGGGLSVQHRDDGLIIQNTQKVKFGSFPERRTAIEPMVQDNTFFERNEGPLNIRFPTIFRLEKINRYCRKFNQCSRKFNLFFWKMFRHAQILLPGLTRVIKGLPLPFLVPRNLQDTRLVITISWELTEKR